MSDVSFDVRPGELHAVMGENGAGKSTLMKILSGVIVDYDGEIRVRDQRVAFRGTRDAEQAGIAIIHQELNLVEQLDVASNIFLGRELTHFGGVLAQGKMEHAAGELLGRLDAAISPRRRFRRCASAISSWSKSPRRCR
ncbi:MAG: ATP-binding cassette domain-containing protein [Pirellulales bacterium]